MATTAQQIDALLAVRSEDEHLEFKEAENNYDFEGLVGYCVALANEGGGRMILGVTDKAPRRVVGTKAFDVPERTGSQWTITNLGAILFAKKLDQFDRLARKAPRVIVYEGMNKLKTKLDKFGTKGYAVGFQGLVEFINNLVPSNEVIEQALRREVKMFPEIAIRELMANALIHQDFTESGTSVIIDIYDDRMEISNPGKPFISPDRFIDEYQSRNERVADLMRRLGICEEKGSGVDKVVQAAEVYQLPAPDFRVSERRTSALLFAHIDIEEMDRNDRIDHPPEN